MGACAIVFSIALLAAGSGDVSADAGRAPTAAPEELAPSSGWLVAQAGETFEEKTIGQEMLVQGAEVEEAEGMQPEQSSAAITSAGGAVPYHVTEIVLAYAEFHPQHPALSQFSNLEVELARGPISLTAPSPGESLVPLRLSHVGDIRLSATAIREINGKIVEAFNALGFSGVLVEPDPAQIDPRTNRDLRPAGETSLRLVIWTGRVMGLRSFASGERIPQDARIDNPAHARIKEQSPLQPVGAGPGTDLMLLTDLEDYLARLNRHPGRRVDASLSPADVPGGVNVDYLITENKPWATYYRVSNTGTRNTGHSRQRFGYSHTQLTGRDDILQLDFITSSFDSEFAAYFGSYEAPLWGFEDQKARWQLSGGWSRFNASDLGLARADFNGTRYGGGLKAIGNLYQRGKLFIDVFTGARWENVQTENVLARISGRDNFFLPEIGAKLERRTQTSNLFGVISVDGNISSIAGTDADDLSAAGGLGRFDPAEDWTTLKWDAYASAYLEPLFNRKAWEDFSTPESSTLAHEVAARFFGQWAFDNRLVPQYQKAVGGLHTVRGYPMASTAGDTVMIGNLEYRLHIPRLFRPRPPEELPVLGRFRVFPQQPGGRADWDLIFKVFADAATVTVSDKKRFEDNDTLLGVGFGFEMQVRRGIQARWDMGWALDEGNTMDVETGDINFHFSITTLY